MNFLPEVIWMSPTVLMDLWGTLIEPAISEDLYYKTRVLELLRVCGLEPSDEELEYAYSTYKKVEEELFHIRKSTLKEILAEKALNIFLKRLGLEVQVESEHLNAYSKPFLEMTRLRKGAREAVKYLSNGYSLILVSNISYSWMGREVLRRNGLLNYFSNTLFSDEVGFRKPHPKIFQLALEMAGSSPSESVMIGDELEDDMLGAKNLGIKTIWIPCGYKSPDPPKYVDEVAFSLVDVHKVVKRLIG